MGFTRWELPILGKRRWCDMASELGGLNLLLDACTTYSLKLLASFGL